MIISLYAPYSTHLFRTLTHPRLVRHLAQIALGGVLVYLILATTASSSWAALLGLLWVAGGAFMLSAQHLGASGVTGWALRLVAALWLKSVSLWWTAFQTQAVAWVLVGDYGLVADDAPARFALCLDAYSLSYIVLTTTIGFWALLFATNYMRNEPRLLQFVVLLYFFLISMILLLAAGNFMTLMLGWELIGCFSFLLINFWTTRVATAKSAFKAFFVNKLSDACLIGGLIVLLVFAPRAYASGFSEIYTLQSTAVTVLGARFSGLDIFAAFIIICSFCKSAQFGFHAWLPDSMEAPVPASALIHSATLVSAGVFLLGRVEVLGSLLWAANILAVWCSFTALYGGVVAAYQTDLKKILAYSTISHCGFLFLLVVYNNFVGLVLYLHLHGWFKSYSFMAAGNLITKAHGYQDYRRMGSGPYGATLEILVLSISLACLGGLPFVLGFFNKHYLLVLAAEAPLSVPTIFTLGAALTGVGYTLKTLSALLLSPYRSASSAVAGVREGLTSRVSLSSEPLSNLGLLAGYPVAITAFAVAVLHQEYWVATTIHYSTFGVVFFWLYTALAFALLRVVWALPLVGVLVVKLLYALTCI